MFRWNPNFVRDLAEGVLARARLIRHGLNASAESAKPKKAASGVRRQAIKKSNKKTAARRSRPRG